MYRSELPLPRVRNLAASFPGTPVFIAIVLAAATWQVLLRRPARAASAFSAEGLGKWTENDLREFVKQHVSGNRTESGRNRDKPGRNPDGTRSSGSWRESPSSSREGSIDRPRTRERSVERPGGEKPGANPTPRNVAADFARTGEKENVPRVPVRQGSVRKEDPGGGPPRSVLGNLRLGASGANGQLELVRTMSLQLPPRPESPPLMRTQSLSSTPGATQRAASINTDLDAFLKEAGFGDFCEPGNVSRSNSINSDFSLETLNTTSGSGRVAQSRSAGGVSTASQPRFGSGLRTGGGEPGSISLPHFVAEDFSGKSGAPQGVLEKGENLGVRLRGGGVPKKLASALSAEAQGIEKFLMGVKMDNQHLDQPKSW